MAIFYFTKDQIAFKLIDLADYYQILGVSHTANEREIKKAFRLKARLYHPDVNNDASALSKFQLLNEAYQVLKSEERRSLYDARLRNGFPADTIYYRPGKVKYRAKGDKYAHYESKDQANPDFEKFEGYFDIVLVATLILVGIFAILYGLYRMFVNPVELVNPIYGLILGSVLIGFIIYFIRNKDRFLKN